MTDTESLAGRTLGHYRILEAIGSGGTAVVHLAEDIRHGRKVAVKVLRPELAAALGHERFLSEITTTAQLRHPHILPLFDSGLVDERDSGGSLLVYYVMPYVEGESLRDRLDREKQLPLDEALRIAREVADALGYAHARGIVHRDIKPENILLEGGHAVVADFGIARAVDAAGGTRMTGTGLVLGTPAYMSPEQAAGQPDLDGRSDLYALACVLYEMVAGQPPFTGPSAESLIRQHLAAEAPPVDRFRPAVPETLTKTLSRALAKAPADRLHPASAFIEALASGAAPAPTGMPPARPTPRGRIALLAAGALVAVAGAAALWWPRAPAPDLSGPPRIAVLPFAPVAADSSLERLGRDLAVTLAANLDGMGELRTVDALTTLAEAPQQGIVTRDEAYRLARRLGAARLVHGTLTRAGGTLRLDAALYLAGSVQPLARVSVSAEDLPGLGDAATIELLDELWRIEPPLAPSMAAIRRSRVPAARRAYLAGELALTRTEWSVAIDAFERAFAADTTFWWAYWRSLYPRSYRETERPDPALVRKVIDHRDELPEPDRLLIEATWVTESLTGQLRELRELTDRFPSYEPALWEYANRLVHAGGYAGHHLDDARDALERVLALNPRFTAGWDHLQWVAILQRDSATARRAGQEAARLAGDAARAEHQSRAMRADAFRSHSMMPDLVGRSVDLLPTFPPGMQELVARGGALADGFPALQIEINRAVRARSPPPGLTSALWEGEALAWAARGAWDSAMVAAARWAALPTGDGALGAYRLAVAGAVLGAVPPEEARSRRPTVGRDAAGGAGHRRWELAWLDGVLAYVDGSANRIAAARRALDLEPPISPLERVHHPLLGHSLAALLLDATGDRERAAREMVALETEIADRSLMHELDDHPLLSTVNRLMAVRWLRSLGRDADAARLLTWHEAITYGIEVQTWSRAIGSVTLVDRAEIAERTGEAQRALRDYTRLLEWYDMADPAMEPVLERARTGVMRLAGER
jgi:eukaryotic-like serine/threonine-protein kinase